MSGCIQHHCLQQLLGVTDLWKGISCKTWESCEVFFKEQRLTNVSVIQKMIYCLDDNNNNYNEECDSSN
jgi:hypothetical protein